MALNISYDKQDEIPEAYRDLFTERDGKWELTGITGMKTQADIDRMQTAITKERDDHKETKGKLKVFVDAKVDLEQHTKDQAELVELRAKIEAGAGSDFDQTKFDEAVERLATSKAATATAPLQTSLDTMTTERDGLTSENQEFKTKETNRTISDAVRSAATEIKIIDTAVDDVLLLGERIFEVGEDGAVLTRDNVGATPGIAPSIWLAEMQEKRPHWWPVAKGGGAAGSGAGGGFTDNPWSNDHWNMTKQGAAVREDRPKAERMATAAGTSIGGLKPVVKKEATA